MTKKLRIIFAIALIFALSLGIGVLAFSQSSTPTVTLNGNTRAFEFSNVADPVPGHEHAGNNLFADLKNVMPGDTAEQKIKVRAANIGSQTATIRLRVEPALYDSQPELTLLRNAYEDLLRNENIKLEVYNGSTLLSSDTLGTGVSLGSFSNNQEKELTVRLAVDKKAGNELAGLHAEIDWVFYGEVTEGGGGGGGGVIIEDPDVPLGPLPELEKDDHYAYIIGRDDGLVHPDANITRAEMATIFFRMLTDDSRAQYWSQTNAYTDVSDAWYNNAISTLTKAGILTGRSDNRFEPNAPITRAEFATILSRFYEAEYVGLDRFSDIAGHWAAGYINKAAANRLLEGYPDGTFRPNNYITRAEAVTGMNRILGRAPHKDFFLADMITWPDNGDTGAWYYEAIQEATNSHHYEMVIDEDAGLLHEKWIELREVRDWAALETEWAALLGKRTTLISSR